jgi:dTDP-4-amino-4,6-dideoxygalactose transaminase
MTTKVVKSANGKTNNIGDYPHAEALAREVLCLPIHPFLADGDVARVAETVLALARE